MSKPMKSLTLQGPGRKPKTTTPPKCQVCGDSGLVALAYIDPSAGMPRAMNKVQCPKCPTPKSTLEMPWQPMGER